MQKFIDVLVYALAAIVLLCGAALLILAAVML